jgi:hypothetical protein
MRDQQQTSTLELSTFKLIGQTTGIKNVAHSFTFLAKASLYNLSGKMNGLLADCFCFNVSPIVHVENKQWPSVSVDRPRNRNWQK